MRHPRRTLTSPPSPTRLQEVKSQPQNVIMDALFEEPWTNALREVVGPHNYVRVSGERLQGLVTNIFVKRHHLPHLRDIHTCVVRTGFGGLWVCGFLEACVFV